MKFLYDLGSCYRRSAQVRQLQPKELGNRVQVVLVSGCNEAWSKPRQKKMNMSKYWRPELSVILEDMVVSFLEIDQGKIQYRHQPVKKEKFYVGDDISVLTLPVHFLMDDMQQSFDHLLLAYIMVMVDDFV
ncbi:hypothetical protein WN944_010820 [Citrus x changshan-huyou]|uniref:Uncharacterized protein n=1 Tax=Citrus x changshan-huyou TaxID=2935761 RepID=A0AAP0QT79_9ROSI